MLVGELVNEQARPACLLEHIVNLGFARDMKALKISDVVSTFIRSQAHNKLWHVMKCPGAFELNYGSRANSAHTHKSVDLAVYLDSE